MRAKHTAHTLPAFPIYSAGFISADVLVLGGGGGSSRAGIKNKLVRLRYWLKLPVELRMSSTQKLLSVGSDQSIELLHELELEQDADAPMSMAVHLEVF
jgi:prolactin regulatory element-binding protein